MLIVYNRKKCAHTHEAEAKTDKKNRVTLTILR